LSSRADTLPPLVVVTTNEERELPAAFVRRCLVLELRLPSGDALEQHLVVRGKAHFGKGCPEDVYLQAAKILVRDREEEAPEGPVRPGQAEYLDLLRAVLDVAEKTQRAPLEVLAEVKEFVLKKNPTGEP
jgi:MoxR-like ATPase